MKLLFKRTDVDERLDAIRGFLRTPWDVVIADASDRAAFAAVLAEADAMVSMSWPVGMPPAPKLRLLHLPGSGMDEIVFDALPADTFVCNVYEHEIGIAEYVLATILEWQIGVRRMDAALRTGSWEGSWMCGPVHRELYGRTVGIVGYGRIGREVARRARAFGTRVIACSRTPGAGDGLVERIEPMSGLDALLGAADFVVVALPLSDGTRGLIDAAALGRMKADGVVINVCRGPVVDEEALFRALADRRIGGAVLDTWYQYPAPGARTGAPSRFPFHTLPNVVMTPHGSAWTDGLLPRRGAIIAGNLDRLAEGQPLVNVVRAPAPTPKDSK